MPGYDDAIKTLTDRAKEKISDELKLAADNPVIVN